MSSSTKMNNSKSSGSTQGDKVNSGTVNGISNSNGNGSARNDSNNMKMNGAAEDILNYGSVDSVHSNFSNLTLPSTSS